MPLADHANKGGGLRSGCFALVEDCLDGLRLSSGFGVDAASFNLECDFASDELVAVQGIPIRYPFSIDHEPPSCNCLRYFASDFSAALIPQRLITLR